MFAAGNHKLSYQCNLPESAFSVTDGKEFCSQCQTTIVDFTEMTDAEIRSHIAAKAGSVCVKIDSDQLKRVKGKKPSFNQYLGVAATATLLALATSAEAQVSDTTKTVQVQNAPNGGAPFPVPIPADTVKVSSCEQGTTLNDPSLPKRPFKKWIFLRLGRRIFFVKNRAPFIGSKRVGLRGKF